MRKSRFEEQLEVPFERENSRVHLLYSAIIHNSNYESVDSGVAQHVRVRLELQTGGRSRALDHPGEAGGGEGRARSLTKMKGDDGLSRRSRRSARSS